MVSHGFASAGRFSGQQKQPAWRWRGGGGSERLQTRTFLLASTGVNSRCVRCVTYIQYIMGFPIFRRL